MVGANGELTHELGLFVKAGFFRAFYPDMEGKGNPRKVKSAYGHLALFLGL